MSAIKNHLFKSFLYLAPLNLDECLQEKQFPKPEGDTFVGVADFFALDWIAKRKITRVQFFDRAEEATRFWKVWFLKNIKTATSPSDFLKKLEAHLYVFQRFYFEDGYEEELARLKGIFPTFRWLQDQNLFKRVQDIANRGRFSYCQLDFFCPQEVRKELLQPIEREGRSYDLIYLSNMEVYTRSSAEYDRYLESLSILFESKVSQHASVIRHIRMENKGRFVQEISPKGASMVPSSNLLLYAAEKDPYLQQHKAFLEYLLNKGVSINATRANGATALHIAFSPEIVDLLIQRGANINAQDEEGSTPLHASLKFPGKVSCLLKQGAAIDMLDNKGRSPLALAVEEKKGRSFFLLLQHQPDPALHQCFDLEKLICFGEQYLIQHPERKEQYEAILEGLKKRSPAELGQGDSFSKHPNCHPYPSDQNGH